jgi:hypothetical protein
LSILTEVNEIEGKVVDTVRSIQKPVVDYVRKGVDLAEGVLPKLPYPQGLPKPADVVSSQFEFAKALLDAQRDFVSEIIDAVAPLVTTPADEAEKVRGATVAAATDEPASEAEAPAPKTAAKPAARRSTTRKSTRSTKTGA